MIFRAVLVVKSAEVIRSVSDRGLLIASIVSSIVKAVVVVSLIEDTIISSIEVSLVVEDVAIGIGVVIEVLALIVPSAL